MSLPLQPSASSTSSSTSSDFLKAVVPPLAAYTDSLLFGEVWARPGLPPRERSLITVAALLALYRPEQLPFHLQRALESGVSRDELVEVITHLAFYAGWPAAVSAARMLGELPADGPAAQ